MPKYSPPNDAEHYVLLRDDARGRWIQFDRPREVLVARRLDDVAPVLRRVEEAVERDGLHAAGYLSYEAAAAFDSALPGGDSPTPLVSFGLYDAPVDCPDDVVRPTDPPPSTDWIATVSPEDYAANVERIRDYIARGDTYQINYTMRLRAPCDFNPSTLWRHMIASQRPPFGAYIVTTDWTIGSSSPELFFSLDGRRILSRPMKGTAARGTTRAADLARAEALRASEKERAENVMIVDMVRNDVGRIARPGSVGVQDLLRVEKYPTVWQMTTGVSGTTDAGLLDILAGLFPAASITGTPKRRAMEIIRELETSPRGVYTGAIGFLSPGRRMQFNVAIRTMVVDRHRNEAEYGVGGGITWDSNAEAERRECETKCRVLGTVTPEFRLLETMRWSRSEGFVLLDRHVRRLRESAEYFDYAFDEEAIRRRLDELERTLSRGDHRVRLLLGRDGEIETQSAPLAPATDARPRVAFGETPVDSSDPFLYHKTTHREAYENARAARPDADDVILFNERGEATESTIANLAVEIDGVLFTPPVACGLLAGTLRAEMLDGDQLVERILTRDDILHAERVFLLNSVRGMYEVDVV